MGLTVKFMGRAERVRLSGCFIQSSEDKISFSRTQHRVSAETRTRELSVPLRVNSNTLTLSNCAPYSGGDTWYNQLFICWGPYGLMMSSQPASETPFKWRFAGGPIVARECLLAGLWINTYISQHRIHQGYSANQTGSYGLLFTKIKLKYP